MAGHGSVDARRLVRPSSRTDAEGFVSARRLCRSTDFNGRGIHDDWVRKEGGLQRLDRLLAMRERESRAVVMWTGRSVTQQAQMHPRSAGRAIANAPIGPRPWDK